jgi:hypothetical protein
VNDLRNRSAREVFEDHLRTAKEWSFEEDIERNFSEELCGIEQARNPQGPRGAQGAEYTTQLVEGDAALLEWTARSESVRVTDGVDSFFIRDGLVVAQTIHYTVEQLG